jgi:hypothetical protein
MRRLSLVLIIASLATPALAQSAAERAACEGDAKKLCPGIRPIGGQLLTCLAKNKAKLTDACKKVVESKGK